MTNSVFAQTCGLNANWEGSACQCRAGYERVGNLCSPCVAGRFKSASGNITTCQLCPAGQYQGSAGQASCINCAQGSYASATGSGECLPCPTGQYADALGSTKCTLCPAGTSSDTLSATSRSQCRDCGLNRYSSDGDSSCRACGVGATTAGSLSSAVCFCPANMYGNPYTSCLNCPANTVKQQTSSLTTSADCSASASCPPGRYGPVGACLNCPADTYKEVFTFTDTTKEAACLSCPQNSNTNGFTGSANKSSCVCSAGFYGTGWDRCDPCPSGTFKNAAGDGASDQVCKSCSGGSTTNGVVGSTSCSFCLPGFFRSGSSCERCPPNRYQDQVNSLPSCKQLKDNAAILNNGTSWGCIEGYGFNVASDSCVACPIGTAKEGINTNPCVSCGAGRTSAMVGSSKCDFCQKGYYLKGSICTQCPRGTYLGTFSIAPKCISCPEGSTTALDGADSCSICLAGYEMDEKQVCTKCAEGFEKLSDGDGKCTAKSANNTSSGKNSDDKTVLIGAIAGGVVALGATVGFAVIAVRRTRQRKREMEKEKMDQKIEMHRMATLRRQASMPGLGQHTMSQAGLFNPVSQMSLSANALNASGMGMVTIPPGMFTNTPQPFMNQFTQSRPNMSRSGSMHQINPMAMGMFTQSAPPMPQLPNMYTQSAPPMPQMNAMGMYTQSAPPMPQMNGMGMYTQGQQMPTQLPPMPQFAPMMMGQTQMDPSNMKTLSRSQMFQQQQYQ